VSNGTSSSGSASSWEEEIRAREEEARAAFLKADLKALDEMWTDGFVVNSPLETVTTKQQVLEALRAGRIRHSASEIEIEHMSRQGDIVIVMGRDTVVDPPDGLTSHRRYTDIWRLEGGKWMVIARHATVVSRQS